MFWVFTTKLASISGLAAVAIIGAVAATTGTVGLTRAASATASWTSSGELRFGDKATGVSITCSSSVATILPSGHANPAGYVSSVSFYSCTASININLELTATGLNWPVSARPATRIIGQVSGGHGIGVKITGIDNSCSADVDGTGAKTNTGKAAFTFTRISGHRALTVTSSNLHIYDPVNCSGLVSNGDPVTFSITYVSS